MTLNARVAVVLACLVAASIGVARADRSEEPPARTTFAHFPFQLGGWAGQQLQPFSDEILAVLGVEDYLTRAYTSASRATVGLYIGYWKSQRQGDTIHSPQNCLPGAGWESVEQGRITIPDPRAAGAAPLEINRFIIQKGLDRQVVLYWYQSHGRIVASEYWGKFYLMADAVRLNRTDGSLVRITVPVRGATPDAVNAAERAGLDFAAVLLPALHGYLPD
jgi:EpsI family protein